MTNAEKETIIALKIQGLGCNRIAKISGVPLGTVKSFLSRTEIELPKSQDGICLECGASIAAVPHTKPRRFCSGDCRQKWWNAHLHLVNRKAFYNFTCPWCGKKVHRLRQRPQDLLFPRVLCGRKEEEWKITRTF